ncbi:MAG: hypothetical protein ACLQPH_14860 [Acidimicrobiales bacterium]
MELSPWLETTIAWLIMIPMLLIAAACAILPVFDIAGNENSSDRIQMRREITGSTRSFLAPPRSNLDEPSSVDRP